MTFNFGGAYQVGRLFLFAFRIRENSEDKDTELNQIRPCNNHICYSLSLSIGRKNRLPGMLTVPQTVLKKHKRKSGHDVH